MIYYSVYDASGNTFVIFNTNVKKDYSQIAINLCKKEDVDGLIIIVPHEKYDFEWLFYNNDGSNASMCGNGTRAVAHYAFNNNISTSNVKFLTQAGQITCTVNDDIVETQMIQPKELKKPFEEKKILWWMVDTGVPHLVTIVNNVDFFDEKICKFMRTKYDSNVNFTSIVNGDIFVRTYERGVEKETKACGTGMLASFLRMKNLQLITDYANVYPKSLEKISIRFYENNFYFKGKVKLLNSREKDNFFKFK